MNIFEAVKEAVKTRQAAEMYGIHVNRNGMACCPFHDDRHPSMKVDGRYHCFGCQEDGDVIDFVAKLFGMGCLDAAKKLAGDFGVAYDGRDRASPRPARKKLSEKLRARQEEAKCFRILSDYNLLLKKWKEEYAPGQPGDTPHPLFEEAVQKQDYIGHLLDILLSGTEEERADLVAGCRKEVVRIGERIAGPTAGGRTGLLGRSGDDGR